MIPSGDKLFLSVSRPARCRFLAATMQEIEARPGSRFQMVLIPFLTFPSNSSALSPHEGITKYVSQNPE